MGRGQRDSGISQTSLCLFAPFGSCSPVNSNRDGNTHKSRKNGSAHRMKATGRDLLALTPSAHTLEV